MSLIGSSPFGNSIDNTDYVSLLNVDILNVSTTLNLGRDDSSQQVGETLIHLFRDDSSILPMLRLEQAGSGDATVGFNKTGSSSWQMGIDSSDTDKFKIGAGTTLDNNSEFVIAVGGNVGIGSGVNNPSEKLHIDENLRVDGNAYVLQSLGLGNTDPQEMLDVSVSARIGGNLKVLNDVSIGTSVFDGESALRIYRDSISNDGILKLEQDGTGDCSMTFELSNNQGWSIGIDNDDDNRFKINNSTSLSTTSEFTIHINGNVGIGSEANNPTQQLEVGGDILVSDGTIYLTNTDEKISSDGTDMTFDVGGVSRMVIDSGGDVTIGSTVQDSVSKLRLYRNDNSSFAILRLEQDGTGDCSLTYGLTAGNSWSTGLDNSNGDKYVIDNATALTDTPKFFIDQSGNVGIGITEAIEKLGVAGDILLTRGSTTSSLTRMLILEGARSASGSNIARIDFSNLDENNDEINYVASRISSENQNGSNKGDLRFHTYDGANLNLSMLISAEGEVAIGTENIDEELTLIGDAGKTVGGTSWNDNSDIRIKENIIDRDTETSLHKINQLRLRKFDLTDDYMEYSKNKVKHKIGLVAQELEETHPECVLTSKNSINNIDNFKKVNVSQLNYEVFGSIQELSKQIIELKKFINDNIIKINY